MADETTTITWKTRAVKVWAWCVAHPATCYVGGAFVLGAFTGWFLAH